VRYCVIGALFLISISCREVLPLGSEVAINGYQLSGTVITPNGVAVPGVDVKLYYDEIIAGSSPNDSQQVVVTDPNKPVDIAVYTPAYKFVKQLFLGYRSVGVLPRWTWSGYDESGNLVPSGKYLIRYVVDTVIVKYSPVLVDGHVTTVTDGFGHFTISADRLPVGAEFDWYNSSGSYQWTYEVTPTIGLVFQKSGVSSHFVAVELATNTITRRVFTLQ